MSDVIDRLMAGEDLKEISTDVASNTVNFISGAEVVRRHITALEAKIEQQQKQINTLLNKLVSQELGSDFISDYDLTNQTIVDTSEITTSGKPAGTGRDRESRQ